MTETAQKTNYLSKFIRTPTKKPYGMITAIGKDQFGFSLCHELDQNNWSKKVALKKALLSAQSGKKKKKKDFDYWVNHFSYKIAKGEFDKKNENKKFGLLELTLLTKNIIKKELNNYDKNKVHHLRIINVLYNMKDMEIRASKYF